MATDDTIDEIALEAARLKVADYTEDERTIYARGYGDRLRRAAHLPYRMIAVYTSDAYGQGWEDASSTLPEGAY